MYTMHNSAFLFCVLCDFIFQLGCVPSAQVAFRFVLREYSRGLGGERWVKPPQATGYILMYGGFADTERERRSAYSAVVLDQIYRETARAVVVVIFQGVHSNTVSEFCIII